jgi:hypothetical protein
MARYLIGLVVCFVVANGSQLLAADDPIKAKLDKAKAAYQASLEQYREAVARYFDKQEEASRNDGNKKRLDQIKAERTAFQETGDLPRTTPGELKRKLAPARSALESAYTAAVCEYTKASKDDMATAVENELEQFKHDGDAPWVELFNSKDVKGWHASEGTRATWRVTGGTLVGNGALGYQITDREDYVNFRLRVEAKLLGVDADSGMCFRVQDPRVANAYEANIHNGRPGDGAMGTLGLFRPAAAGGGVVFAAKGQDVPAGQWFTMEVLVKGNRFTTWVDTKKACESEDPENRLRRGAIALQQNTGVVSFRKVEIKELPAK